MMRLWQRPWLLFVLVVIWKVVLAFATVQPVPANDSFFYDGPVVNLIRNGHYTNPSLQLALPISSEQVFSAYPPVYQGILLTWMVVAGTSAKSAVIFHVILFSIYVLLAYRILKVLNLPAWVMYAAGAFLFSITFHDRPDSLAHVLGMAALLSGVKTRCDAPGFRWASCVLVVLCLATSIQIGAAYAFMVFGFMLTVSGWSDLRRLLPVITGLATPVVLVLVIKVWAPLWWEGFLEHARQTPSFTGLRVPETGDLLKIVKAVPGILMVVAVGLLWCLGSIPGKPFGVRWQSFRAAQPGTIMFVWLIGAACIIVCASLVFLTSNTIAIATYLQPLVVACGLAILVPPRRRVLSMVALTPFILLASTRAIGMSTWGVVAAADISYSESVELARTALSKASEGDIVVLSAPYLYESTSFPKLKVIHSDWLGPARPRGVDAPLDEDIRKVKPSLLLLTQFDYYRRYIGILRSIQDRSDVEILTRNTAHIEVPDASPRLQRIVQHVSWAPVIVELKWKHSEGKVE